MRFHARFILALGAALAALLSVAEARDRALVIGVNHYPDVVVLDSQGTKQQGQLDLRGPVIDAGNIARMLVDTLGFDKADVKVLLDANASREAILSTFQSWLIDGTAAGDRAFFFFSGHGVQVMVPDGKGGQRLTSAIVPADARNDIDPTTNTAGGLILGPQLGALVEKLAGRLVTIVADSCFSGSITRGLTSVAKPDPSIRTITPNGPLDLDPSEVTDDLIRESKTGVRLLDFNARGGTPMDGVAVWSAATISQFSFDSPDGNGGVFTNAFVSGLRDRKADSAGRGRVTASDLLAYVRDVAGEFCASRVNCTQGFTPELLAPDSYRATVLAPYRPAQVAVLPAAPPSSPPSSPPETLPSSPPVTTPSSSPATTQSPPSAPTPPSVPVTPPSSSPATPPSSSPATTESPPPTPQPPPVPVTPPSSPLVAPPSSPLVAPPPSPPVAPPSAPPAAPAPSPPAAPPSGPALVDLAEGIFSHHNDFGLSAEILPSSRIKQGATVQFRIASGERGQLLVFDTGPDGTFRRIYPNEYSDAAGRKGLINASAPLTIPDESYPFAFTATDVGPGTLVVLVAEPGVDLKPLAGGAAFEPTTDAHRALVAVAANLQAPALNPDPNVPNRAHRWAFVTVPYVVEQ